MKTKTLLLSAIAGLALASCQKDPIGGLRLWVEPMDNGSKMVVEGSIAHWVANDPVLINGVSFTVTVSNNGTATATTSSEGVSAPYFGVYPANICGNNTGDSCILNLPASYTYGTTTYNNSTMQNLATPMVAYAASGDDLVFKHVTGALNVEIKNDFGIDIRVTNITISSNKYQLSGARTVAIGSDFSVAPKPAEGDGNAYLRQVQMNFNETQLYIACGGTAVVQVPVLPVANDNRFTISVTVKNKDDADMTYTFTKTQAGGISDDDHAYELGRAMLGYVPVKFGGVFTVAPDKQVRIAPGNLQYQASSGGTWRFAKHQYDAIGNALGNSNFTDTRSTQADWIDLFGWGTSGHEHGNTNFMPYVNWYTSGNNAFGYGPKTGYNYNLNLTISNKGDWGVNAISNGGNIEAIWRTLSQTQLDSLLNKRSCNTINGFSNGRFAKATIKDGVLEVQGLIIFPDDYVHPTDVDPLWAINITGSGGMNENKIDLASWNKMEVAGAVFLPITGIAKNAVISNVDEGCYWSTTYYNNSNRYYAKCLNFKNILLSVSDNQYRYHGCAVRLVRDVE